ncbi:endonuclease/exonuclease/phosphatase family protein [Devosia sp. A16]|uniref:endonuclease/exonuclease/phosphatase family protein n=1 Tax=Devosia sp. A16 TaxID=1736675 RepID=UPI0006D77239|nr:endonuclease/exonuclease/phosphatase family protein [Devosia sp. A16]
MLRELRGGLTALALVVSAVLAAVSIELGIPGQALLQSLRFHIAAALLGLVVLLFLGGAWRRALLFLLAFAVSTGQGAAVIYRQQEARDPLVAAAGKPLLKLLSFNILSGNPNGETIARFVAGSGADLVVLLEAAPVAAYVGILRASYPYSAGCEDGDRCGGVVILSRTPLADVSVQSMSGIWVNRLVTATTEVLGQKVNIVAAHLVKPYFDDFAAQELAKLGAVIGKLEGPVVLAGDFNAAAWSGAIDRLITRQQLLPGPAYPATWPVRLGPLGVPIDNVFTRAPLVIWNIEAVADAMGSNHRGLMAEIGMAGD